MSLLERWPRALLDTYGTPRIALVRGEGAHVWDEQGRRYVDLLAGIAVNVLGHAHPAVVEAVTRQVATLGHISNLYASEPTVRLAERLLELVGRDGRVFLCNSGTEANEAAFKLSRLTGRTGLVAAEGSFHGRTMGALALTGQPAKQDPFRPLPGDVRFVPYGETPALRAAVDHSTAAVVLEPVQGEGGVVTPPEGYLVEAERAAHDAGALLVLDEVQTGIARTGSWFAHQPTGARPDVVTLAKGLGGGLPIGACIVLGDAAGLMRPGLHASTFGGNPIACAAALAVLDTVEREGLTERAKALGERLVDGVLSTGHPLVDGVRGSGALLGIRLSQPVAADTTAALAEAGFLVNAVAPAVLRLAPPLVLSDGDADAFAAALPAALDRAAAAASVAPDQDRGRS